ncbi:MAG: hypothetical protein V1720_14405 [bacterium]
MLPLLPNKFRVVGWIALLAGSILGIIRFYFDIKPEFMNIKVFAIYSKYFETKYFSVIDNHFSEETTALLLIIGLFLFSFTKEKVENDTVISLRLKALLWALAINTVFIAGSFLFVYGFIFINILVINVFTPFILYIIIFRALQILKK